MNCSFFIALRKVDVGGLIHVAYRYFARSVLVCFFRKMTFALLDIWFILAISRSMSELVIEDCPVVEDLGLVMFLDFTCYM